MRHQESVAYEQRKIRFLTVSLIFGSQSFQLSCPQIQWRQVCQTLDLLESVPYNKFSQLFSINQIGAYFVVRAKKNIQYKVVKWKRRLPKNVLSDCIIEFTEYRVTKEYPKQLRLVRFFDEEQGGEFAFLTNATHVSSSLVAELYKNRWQIELFFKWLKQHLKIKKFWGTTENAVRIQIYVAICTYLLVTIVKNNMKLERSTCEVLQILSISLTAKAHLKDLFDKTKF